MTEPDASAETPDESTADQLEDTYQPPVDDFVTEITIREKEFSFSGGYSTEAPFNQGGYRYRDPTLSDVTKAFSDILRWVGEANDEEWELEEFQLETTIVVQRREEEKNSSDEEQSETEDSLIGE